MTAKLKLEMTMLLGLAILASAHAAFAREFDSRGASAASRPSARGGGAIRPGVSVSPGYQGVRPAGHPGWQGVRPAGRPGWQGVRPINSPHPQPGVVINHSPHHGHHGHHGHHRPRYPFFFGSAIFLGAPVVYGSPVVVPPPAPTVYIEQGSEIYYFCPDYQQYYPSVTTCPSPWLRVLPDGTLYTE